MISEGQLLNGLTTDPEIFYSGGTVGDIESAPFIESMRELRRQLRTRAGNNEDFVGTSAYVIAAFADKLKLHIHVTYIPVIHGEQKTKLTQQAIRDVRSAGLFPDLIACRCEQVLQSSTVEKVAQYCQVPLLFKKSMAAN